MMIFLPFGGGFVLLFFPLQNESELFGRTIRVNLAKPMRIKEGSSRPGESVPGRGEHLRGCSKLRASAFLSGSPDLEAETLRPRDLSSILITKNIPQFFGWEDSWLHFQLPSCPLTEGTARTHVPGRITHTSGHICKSGRGQGHPEQLPCVGGVAGNRP